MDIVVFNLILKLPNFKIDIMKNNYLFIFFSILILFCSSLIKAQCPSPIVVNSTDQLEVFDMVNNVANNATTLKLKTEELTGKDFLIYFSIEGDLAADCTKKITVTHSGQLENLSTTNPFFPNGTQNPKISYNLPGNESQSFNLKYKFPGFTTCNGTVGSITVKIELSCGQVFEKVMQITARAQNTWTFNGNRDYEADYCDTYYFQTNANICFPNGYGLGVYSISGNFSATLPDNSVVSEDYFNKESSFRFAQDPSNCMVNVPTHTLVNYDFHPSNSECVESFLTGTISAENSIGTAPYLIGPFEIYHSNEIFTNSYNSTNQPIPPGTVSQLSVGIYQFNPSTYSTNVTATIIISGAVTVTSVTDSDGNSYPVTSNNQYTFNWSEILIGKDLIFDYYVNSNAVPGSIVSICSTVTQTANLLAEANCERCAYETGTFTDSKCSNIRVDEYPPQPPQSFVKKCIVNQQIGYLVGDQIDFRIFIVNPTSNQAFNINDQLQTISQNLTLSGTPTIGYYTYLYDGITQSCNGIGNLITNTLPFAVNENHVGTTLNWEIPDLPADPYRALVFDFSATINPQTAGTKTNICTGDAVYYNVYEYGKLRIDKVAEESVVNIGDTFKYEITVTNSGTLDISNIVISDALPDCVELNETVEITVVDQNNVPVEFTTNGNLNIAIQNRSLNIGEHFKIIFSAKKMTNGVCCNVASVTGLVTAYGINTSASSTNSPACVTSPSTSSTEVSKCIVDPQVNYSLGDPIQFRILVKNTGNVAGNIQLIDQLQASQQNINLTGTPTFNYYSEGDCAGLGSILPLVNPFSVNENHIGNTLDWNIANIPFDPEKVLVIEFSGTIANNSTAEKTNIVNDGAGNTVASVTYQTLREGNCPELDFKPFKPAVPNIFTASVVTEINSGNDNIIDKEYGDIDNDGDIDILYTKLGQLHVLINTAGVGNAPIFNSTGTPLNLNFPAIGTHLNYPTSGTHAISYRLFDWDNDGDNDLIVLAGREGYADRVAGGVFLFYNDGSGHFNSPPVLLLNAMAFGDDFGYDASNDFPGEINQFIEVGDLNGDHLPDILITGKMRITGIVYFENNGSGFDLVAPQIMAFPTTPSYFYNWIQNPLFPPHGNSFQVPELYTKDCSAKLNLFVSDPLWYDSINNEYGGGRMFFHENGGNNTSGIFPDFNRTGLINQFGFNDDLSSNLRCDWVVTRFVDFLGNGCPIAIVFNYCTKQFIYYDQECSPETLTTNTSVKNKSEITLYPNPTKDWVNFYASPDIKIQRIAIFDASGKLVIEPKISGTKINIQNLIQGVYFVNFQTDKGLRSEKLIVK